MSISTTFPQLPSSYTGATVWRTNKHDLQINATGHPAQTAVSNTGTDAFYLLQGFNQCDIVFFKLSHLNNNTTFLNKSIYLLFPPAS